MWFQNRRTKHKRDKEKQAEHREATAESMATQSLLHILQPRGGGNSPPAHPHPHPQPQPHPHTQQGSHTLHDLLHTSPGTLRLPEASGRAVVVRGGGSGLSPPLKSATYPRQVDHLARRGVAAEALHPASLVSPPLSEFGLQRPSTGSSCSLAFSPIHSMASPPALHPVVSRAAAINAGFGAGLSAGLATSGGQVPVGYGIAANEAWFSDPFVTHQPPFGSALHVRFPTAWPLYQHVPQGLP